MRLVSVAHGTRHATGNDVAARITAAAGERLGVPAVASYVELAEPLFADVMAAGSGAVVPLLLSTGYHVRHDLPRMVGAGLLGRPLGPDPLLAQAQAERLREVGAEPGRPVVLVAAGSSDPVADRDQRLAAQYLGEEWGAPVQVATLAGRGRRPVEVVTPDHAVSLYLLSPGFFADRARRESGCELVSEVLGDHRLVVELVVQRYRALTQARVSA
ncbi:sirohydrochlorin chelatase [Nocardioides mangrovicus]|uniref:Sirohydrochlorin chelatase n=1 Tax=Nocardioides mangrovicus TaxID=2478913 RepID=A0A3L8NZR6_9ACTN|nr:CbiX/SirB N-terminal domain-containing protein [Nocardioides mangrovicus]RLV48271.1 sirohydrochlorin chelatase [Nocardioides mangrovicus]